MLGDQADEEVGDCRSRAPTFDAATPSSPNPPSPVRIPESPMPKTARNHGNSSVDRWMFRGGLCNHRLNGGGRSRGRTSLRGRVPELQGKYREFLPDLMVLEDPELSFPSVSEAVAMASL